MAPKKLNDAVYEIYRPASGPISLEIVFFHGFQTPDCREAPVDTRMPVDEPASWLSKLLAEEFPQSRILSVSYDSSTEITNTDGRMDMYIVGENLVISIIDLAEVGQTCPVVLVGYSVGGLVLKEVCCQAEAVGSRPNHSTVNRCKTFLRSMKGAFCINTAQMGTRIPAASKRRGPLLEYYEFLNENCARLNSDFGELRKREQYRWKTFGVWETAASENLQRPSSIVKKAISLLPWVKRKPVSELEEASARNDMDSFCVVSGDRSLTIHEPKVTRSERTIPVRSETLAKCEPVTELGEASARHDVDRFCAPEVRSLAIHKPKAIPVRSLAGVKREPETSEVESTEVRSLAGVKREPETSEVESTEARNEGHSVSPEHWSLAIREPVITESERINPVNLSFGQKRNREGSSRAIYNPYDRTSSVYQLLANFLRDILHDVESVKKRWRHIFLPEQFVATAAVEVLIARLRLGEPEPARMSLVGMGGIGKTTLVKAVLLELRSQFDYVCFIEDLKEKLKEHKELHTLIGNSLYTGAGYKVRMVDVDQEAIWERLEGKRVLLIMDNIDSESDIRALLEPDWVDEGSRLITTSCVRSMEFMPSFMRYDVPFLSDEESDKLFRRHVHADVVGKIPNDLICKIVDKCDGLPLTIEVIGRYLYRQESVSIWRGALESLKAAESINGSEDDKLWAKLRVSFDKLRPREREMFLDLASFDKDESDGLQYELSVWKAIWQANCTKSSVKTCLKNLSDKCFIRGIRGTYGWGTSFVESLRHESCGSLITSDQDKELTEGATFVWIHEQLRDMGRSICRPPGEVSLCRGVWKPDDVDQLSKYPEELSSSIKTESLVLTESKSTESHTRCGFPSGKRLDKIRLMRLCDIHEYRLDANIYVHIDCLPKLAVLHMVFSPDSGENIPDPLVKLINKSRAKPTVLILDNVPLFMWSLFHEPCRLEKQAILIFRRLSWSLDSEFRNRSTWPVNMVFGAFFVEQCQVAKLNYGLPAAKKILIRDCPFLEELPLLYPSRIERLMLENLPALPHLASSLPLTFHSLKDLRIIRCKSLELLPEELGMSIDLSSVQIKECDNLEHLWESLGRNKSMSDLSIDSCFQLRHLPNSLGELTALQELKLCRLSISILPDSIGALKDLRTFWLSELDSLESLPDSIGQLESLKFLRIQKCGTLNQLPETVGQLHALEVFELEDCASLDWLPVSLRKLREVTNLVLKISGCADFSAV
ncbi:hypothetical protein R1flu_024965 [Riccia fluitans]|uniref:NB-ARC domain-containing protein n=1 Tax=Riccia fluitans TaxID=41844 RepID=A0ABD1Y0H8_9MARC